MKHELSFCLESLTSLVPIDDTVEFYIKEGPDDMVEFYNFYSACTDTTAIQNGIITKMHESEGLWNFRGGAK